ncbi:TetR/AcrR family transcriptional regulator [Vibrio parahaemolyticus]|uniref:TetR/AcrR family transcriptional regulator n=1 Tax=Vibrio parahaemolyticus TaxID=670 RepID=UPI0003ED93D5|nr:TetR/AcrR family transcriptional regulator C-terminal domain-containing protein [Vibrio parahaemolyticus]AHJ01516.1 Transcriptional regulator, TetR family [Vibrio parahaemolyticus UCM-V493]EGQ9700845.1 TetR family transcriptional regulator [Vibrio parahaemolyticus]EHH1060929.1 TetR family transcriptional regulator [Vibrio parahaemolyticus]EJB0391366.1 TetR/AcrR family transcriptional regulator C-terminal domain-containing protein [Vibrio parahaemolyticus]EJG0734698.1 TetR/AcrR family transc
MSVNEKKRGRPTAKQSQLSAESILDSANLLMKKAGKIPSVRLLATQLDVDPMAIYYYFKNKNALLEALTTSLVEDIYQPQANEDWQNELKHLCASYIELLREYNGLLQTMLSMTSHGPAQVFTERYQLIVQPLGLSQQVEQDSLDLLADYLHGFALSISCCHDASLIKTDMLDGPLNLICSSLLASRT